MAEEDDLNRDTSDFQFQARKKSKIIDFTAQQLITNNIYVSN